MALQQLITELMPYLLTALGSILAFHVRIVHKIRIKVAILEQKVESLQKRVDSHSKKNDEFIESIADLKSETSSQFADLKSVFSKQLSDIAVDIAKINTTLSIIDKG